MRDPQDESNRSRSGGAEWLAAMDYIEPLFKLPPRLHSTSAWIGHIPFLFLLFKLARPRSFVELGVHYGTSFLAACEAAKCFETGTRCSGVDTWRGDDHAGFYAGNAIYDELRSFVDARYPSCDLIQATFDDAVSRFGDGTIDLLHIDGLHTYEAVSHDFQNWRPKLSNRSIVLFHDTEVRTQGFGVWKFWSEVKEGHLFLDFQHSFGLGVLVIGADIPAGVADLFRQLDADDSKREIFKAVCEAAGTTLPMRVGRRAAAAVAAGAADASKDGKVGRNDPCPCGSGKRFKHCHGALV